MHTLCEFYYVITLIVKITLASSFITFIKSLFKTKKNISPNMLQHKPIRNGHESPRTVRPVEVCCKFIPLSSNLRVILIELGHNFHKTQTFS